MSFSQSMRQTHRWLSIAFTVAVIVTSVVMAQDEPAVWVSYAPLLPLALLFVSGLYLFALPYATRWRGE
jgi:heme A synthase